MAETKVTRIKADSAPKVAPAKTAKKSPAAEPTTRKGFPKLIFAIGGYFKGAWQELRQVRWPDRKATWGLTLAVLLFTAFFMVLILTLDALFKWISGLILG